MEAPSTIVHILKFVSPPSAISIRRGFIIRNEPRMGYLHQRSPFTAASSEGRIDEVKKKKQNKKCICMQMRLYDGATRYGAQSFLRFVAA